jgi:hypothetical protein
MCGPQRGTVEHFPRVLVFFNEKYTPLATVLRISMIFMGLGSS